MNMNNVRRVSLNPDDTVDEIVFRDAYVHLEDLGDAYMLIIEDTDQHVHVTIPARRHRKAFIYEQHDKTEGTVTP